MDSAPSIETVLQALQALYRPNAGDSGGHEKASAWLGDMQKSVGYIAVYTWDFLILKSDSAKSLLRLNFSRQWVYFDRTISSLFSLSVMSLLPCFDL